MEIWTIGLDAALGRVKIRTYKGFLLFFFKELVRDMDVR